MENKSGVGIIRVNEVGGHQHNLFNNLIPDDTMSQYFQQVYTPRTDHVVH